MDCNNVLIKDEAFINLCEKNRLTCPICYDPYDRPHIITNCLHVYCINCLSQLIQQKKACSICSNAFTIENIKHDFDKSWRVEELFKEYKLNPNKQNPLKDSQAIPKNVCNESSSKKIEAPGYLELVNMAVLSISVNSKDGLVKVKLDGSVIKGNLVILSEDKTNLVAISGNGEIRGNIIFLNCDGDVSYSPGIKLTGFLKFS